jgi:hypothetical protein
MDKYISELELLYSAMSQKERHLLVNLLREEKENIIHYESQVEWVEDRIKTINSILSMMENN